MIDLKKIYVYIPEKYGLRMAPFAMCVMDNSNTSEPKCSLCTEGY